MTLALVALCGCGYTPVEDLDEIFYNWDDRRVFCTTGIDSIAGNGLETIERGLARAAERGEVIQLYGHSPYRTVPIEKLEAILARAAELGLDFVTYPELGPNAPRRAALALSFDDANIDVWYASRELFQRYDAQVTFYITRYHVWDDTMRQQLRELATDGHAIEAHAVDHLRAPDYVAQHGLAAYLANEALPSIDRLAADGYVVTDYAYPFGARTSELDHALLEHVDRVRAVSFSLDGPLVADPCPE